MSELLFCWELNLISQAPTSEVAQDWFTSTGWDPSSLWDISGFSEFQIYFFFQNLGSGLLQFLFKLLEGKRLNVFGSIAKIWSCAAWGICFLLSQGLPWNLKTPGCATLIYKHSKQYKSLKIKAVLLSLQSRSFFKEFLMQEQNHFQLLLWSFYSVLSWTFNPCWGCSEKQEEIAKWSRRGWGTARTFNHPHPERGWCWPRQREAEMAIKNYSWWGIKI